MYEKKIMQVNCHGELVVPSNKQAFRDPSIRQDDNILFFSDNLFFKKAMIKTHFCFLFYFLSFTAFLPSKGFAQNQTIMKEISCHLQLQYLIQLPDSYDQDSLKPWPVIFFLHGAGERGNDLEKVKTWGPPKIASKKGLPFIVVSPQCPENQWWTALLLPLNNILDEVINTYRVDEQRVYLTGLSMGGFGTWALAAHYPARFAALAPICGGGNKFHAQKLADIPVWAFHGKDDKVILPECTEEMVDALKKAGGNVHYTLYEGIDHFSWIKAYNESELFDWFLSIKKVKQ